MTPFPPILLTLLQDEPSPPATTILLLVLGGVILLVGGYFIGKFWAGIGHRREGRRRENLMFQLEKSLADFFEHEKSKLVEEKQLLEQEVAHLREHLEETRKKAVGAGRMGKDARSDLLLNLLLENEALQEKLFDEHRRQKEEKDRHLKQELKNLSYQRVLISRLLEESSVRSALGEILKDDKKLRELMAQTPRLSEPDARDAEFTRSSGE